MLSGDKNEKVWVAPVQGVSVPLVETGKSTEPAPKGLTGGDQQQQAASIAIPTTLPKPGETIPSGGKPRIAIVIDDMGLNPARSKRAIALPRPVTLSFLPYASKTVELAKEARAAGHEILLHLPMEPLGAEDPGPDALLTGLSPEEQRARTIKALETFSGYSGVNNHMGSKFTESREGMDVVIGVLKEKGLFFFDSMTSPKSVAALAARGQGVPFAKRDVFLDNTSSEAAIRAQLAKLEQIARKNGQAVGIGHPNPVLVGALEKWLTEAEKNGFLIVPLRDLVKSE